MKPNTLQLDTSATPPELSFAPSFNVAGPFIDRHAGEGRGDKPAIRTTQRDVTYAELRQGVDRCAYCLDSLGLARGDRVVMIVKDCPEFVYLFWGAIKAGLVPVPLNTLLRAADYSGMIEDSGCELVITSPEYETEVREALAEARQRPQLLATEGTGDTLAERLATLPNAAADPFQAVPAAPDDIAFWLYSSGSSGRPKGVVHRHRDIVVTCVRYAEGVLELGEDDVCFSAAKLFFAYGLGNAMTFPLWAGATAILSDLRPTPAMTFELIERFRPTLFFGVPTLYAAQLEALKQDPRDLSSLRACVSAGEALPADIWRRWREATGLTILDGIGSTELLHIFLSNRLDDCRPGTSGKPVPGYEARILNEAGEAVAPGDSGRLFVQGASSTPYYWNNPEKTAETIHGEWLDTSDTYSQDDDGYFVFSGRSDDMLKVGGIWCSPIEIESRLIEHPKVLEAAVIGREDEHGLTKPAAYIVLAAPSESANDLEDVLKQHCKTGLAPYKYPRWWTFVDELPKTATGKIQRFKLRDRRAESP